MVSLMRRGILLLSLCSCLAAVSSAQLPGPWNNPLLIAFSSDGAVFTTPQVFQDSSGVPSMAKDSAGRLVAVFQWFPAPMHGLHWDSVAVKFSQDDGLTWSSPAPIIVNGMPPGFQRPFDPAIIVLENGMYRLFFSSGIPPAAGADSTIDTYSAISADGIHYQFEPGARVNHPSKRVIDPSVLKFKGLWHYIAPIGAPQEGAYHYISNDGLQFQPTPNIPSDPQHNWTGNLMTENNDEMRFYGCGPWIWYSSTPNGGQWLPPVNTNLHGGDPAVIKTASNSYVMIFTGLTPPAAIDEHDNRCRTVIFPNPSGYRATIYFEMDKSELVNIALFNPDGRLVKTIAQQQYEPGKHQVRLDVSDLSPGTCFYSIKTGDSFSSGKIVVIR
jgi:hypothetical protein